MTPPVPTNKQHCKDRPHEAARAGRYLVHRDSSFPDTIRHPVPDNRVIGEGLTGALPTVRLPHVRRRRIRRPHLRARYGNARIQVFGDRGNYITEWASPARARG